MRVIEFKDSGTNCNHCRLTNSAFIGYNHADNSSLFTGLQSTDNTTVLTIISLAQRR